MSFRERLREIMEPFEGGPEASIASLVVDIIVLVAIAVSCALVIIEWTHPDRPEVYLPAEVFFTTLFVIEYLLRWYSAENRWLYPLKPIAVLDFLAILPGLLLLSPEFLMLRMVRGVRILRLLRLMRLVRLLRLLRYGPLIFKSLMQARVWFSSIVYQYRLGELGRLFLWSVVALFIGANVIHLIEIGFDDQVGPFDGYWRSYWNTLIVLVSGIEDKEPLTVGGRAAVTVLLIIGLVIVGMLTAEIVAILVRRAQRVGKIAIKPPKSRFFGHIVILGRNAHLDTIVQQVNAALKGFHNILVVDPAADELSIDDPKTFRRVFALSGDPRQTRVLDEADLDTAARVIVLAPEAERDQERAADNKTLMAMVAATCQRRNIPMVVELLLEKSLRYTRSLPELDFVVGRQFGEGLSSQAILNSGVTEIYSELLTFTEDSNELYSFPVPDALVGKTFAEAQLYFLDQQDDEITLIGIDRSPEETPSADFTLCPQAPQADLDREALQLRRGDKLVVLAYEQPVLSSARDPWSSAALDRS